MPRRELPQPERSVTPTKTWADVLAARLAAERAPYASHLERIRALQAAGALVDECWSMR